MKNSSAIGGLRIAAWKLAGVLALFFILPQGSHAIEHLVLQASGHFDARPGAYYSTPAVAYYTVPIPARGWFRGEVTGSPALFGGPDGNNPNYHFSTQLTAVGEVNLGNFTSTNIEVAPIITNRNGLLPNGGSFAAKVVGPQMISFTWGDFIGGDAQDFTARGYFDPSPVADAGANQALLAGTAGTLRGVGTDVDHDTSLTYQWTRLLGPDLALSSTTVARPTIHAPSLSSPATTRMQLIVSDAHSASVADTVDIITYVAGGNIPPICKAGADNTTGSYTIPIRLNGTQSYDIEGFALLYSWTQVGGPRVALSDPTAAKPTFKQYEPADADQTYSFELVVCDGFDLSAPDTVSTVVVGFHDGPVPVGPREQSIATKSGSVPQVTQAQHNGGTPPATATFPNISIPGAGRLRTEVKGTPGLFNGPDGNNPHFHLSSNGSRWDAAATSGFRQTKIETAPVIANTYFEVAAAGTKTLTVNGPQALSYTFLDYLYGEAQSFDIVIWFRPASLPPTAKAGVYGDVYGGEIVRLDGRASFDPDGDPLSYLWQRTSGPAVTLSNNASPVPLFKVPQVTTATTLTFSLVVSDGQNSAPATATLKIMPGKRNAAGGWRQYQ